MPSEVFKRYEARNVVFGGLILAAIVVGVIHAVSLWYVNDDCFVSFRYAKNLINGVGLVYNAGEWVEGYTNFLWTMVIALGLKFGADPVTLSTTLGIVFYAFTLALYGFLSWKFKSGGKSSFFLIPLTTIALCLHREFSAHATSGMETSMFSFLISCSFAVLILGRSIRSLVVAGLLLVLAMMTRPDGFIFLAASVVYVVITHRRPLKESAVLMLPTVIIFLPYWLWRWSYFGFFFPNAFYAKSISLAYYTQGLEYTWLYFKTYYVLFLLPVLGIYFAWKSAAAGRGGTIVRNSLRRLRPDPGSTHPRLLAALFIIPYVLFVVRIGGDFMFARFFIAITPLMYFSIELMLRRISNRAAYMGMVFVVLVGTLARWDQYGNDVFVGYVADESRYFTRDDQVRAESDGIRMHTYFEGYPVRLAFWAGQLRIAYYIDPSYAIECSGGLTDAAVAHQSLAARGRPGHEKQPTLDYLIDKNVDFNIGVSPPPPGQFVLNAISFGNIVARIIVYDNRIMDHLSQYPEIRFTNFPQYLDAYVGSIASYPREKVEEDYEFFKSYYFDHNQDERREQAFRTVLNKTSSPPARGG